MGSTHTHTVGAYTITVWMISVQLWAYIVTTKTSFKRGTVQADNHIDATGHALAEVMAEVAS